MKTKIKRHSRSVLAVILTISLLMSCMAVGMIATDAAKVREGGEEAVGAKLEADADEEAVGAKVDEDGTVGWNPSTDKFNIHTKPSGGDWSSWSNLSFNSSGVTTFTIANDNTDIEFDLTFGGTTYKLDSSQSGFTAAQIRKTSGTERLAKSSGNKTYTVSGVYAGTYTVTLTSTINNGEVKFKISGEGSGPAVCSTTEQYVVVGEQHLTNLTSWKNKWDEATSRNQMVYDSTIEMYKIEYTNIDASTDGFKFRIVKNNTWDDFRAFPQATLVDEASPSLATISDSEDNNSIKMTLSAKANITITYTDANVVGDSDSSKSVTITVTPAVSTVTAGTAQVNGEAASAAGTIQVNKAASATNIAYGGNVSLTATAGTNYHFKNWVANDKLVFTNASAATTTAAVYGTTTVTAEFEGDSFNIVKSATNCTITAPNTAAYTSTVTVSATAAAGYFIDGLYYIEADDAENTKHWISGFTTTTTNESTGDQTFTMPAKNITIYGQTHAKGSQTITYSSDTDGYVSVGEQYTVDTTYITRTIATNSTEYEGTKVLFCAIPKKNKRFVAWRDGSESGDIVSLDANYVYTVGSSGTLSLFADFDDAVADLDTTPDGKIRLLIGTSDIAAGADIWAYVEGSDGSSVQIGPETTVVGNKTYYVVELEDSINRVIFRTLNANGTWNKQSKTFTVEAEKTYYCGWGGSGEGYMDTNGVNTKYASDTFPITLNVTNPERGTTYVKAYADNTASVTVSATATEPDVHKATVACAKTSNSSAVAVTNKAFAMPAEAVTVTVAYPEWDYYKVTFSAGSGGSISATVDGETPITSGTMVKEGSNVVITAAPASGNAVSGWTGDASGTSSTVTFNPLTESKTVRVYFTKDKPSTKASNTYFGWFTTSSLSDTNARPQLFNVEDAYTENGHTYGYIDTIANYSNYIVIAAFSSKATSDADKCKTMYYHSDSARSDDGNIWYNTDDFDPYFTDQGRQNYKVNYDSKDIYTYYIYFKVTEEVKGLIIDLGTTNADGSTTVSNNCYRIIPVLNKDVNKVTVYAKDGSYRGDSDYDYFPNIADTVITSSDFVTDIKSCAKFETAVATKGKSITVTTTIDDNHKLAFYVRGFCINGVTPTLHEPTEVTTSGGVYNCSGVYTETYTIPADFDGEYIEITPIYYYRHDNVTEGSAFTDDHFVQFYIENYDEALQATGWGNTLSVYPYYQDAVGNYVKGKQNAFGGYPGQPVINYGGRRFIEIPTYYKTFTVDNNEVSEQEKPCYIKGITLSNDYYDVVHRDYVGAVSEHKQTYDYDDFYKIYKETIDGKEVNDNDDLDNAQRRNKVADQITFAFKYRTAKDNFSDSAVTATEANYDAGSSSGDIKQPYASFTNAEKTSKFGNGWEELLDYMDRPIDIFGKQLTTEEQAKEPVLIVSDDYKITYAGYYATTWTVYVKNAGGYDKVAEIAPSALIVTSSDRLTAHDPDDPDGDPDHPYPTVADQYNLTQTTLESYIDAYEALEDYRGYPALITFEKAIKNANGTEKYFSKDYTEGSETKTRKSEVAQRSDGRWYYSYYNDTIHASIRIEYKDDESDENWTVDPFKGDTNQGTVTGGKAYFDNDGDFQYKTETGDITANQNSFYELKATQASGYVFAGWWFERDKIVTPVNEDTTKLDGQSQMTSNAVFVARYIKNPSGTLTVNHTVADSSVGTGKTFVKVEAINKSDSTDTTILTTHEVGGTSTVWYEDGFTIDDPKYMTYKSGYKFNITLKTVTGDIFTVFDRFSASVGAAPFLSTVNQETGDNLDGTTTTTTYFEVDVDDLFEIQGGFPTQKLEILDYYSHLKSGTYTYMLAYSFDPYVGKYGRQGYDVSGTLSYEDLQEYFTLGTVEDEKRLVFNNTEGTTDKQTTFLNKMAPYENNFMQNNTWNTAGASIEYNAGYDLKVSINETENLADDIHVTLSFPYTYGKYSQKHAAVTNPEDGNKVYKTENQISLGANHKYNDVYSLNSTKRIDHDDNLPDPEFITAPDSIWSQPEGSDEYTVRWDFQYWSVKTTSEDGGKHVSTEYTRCYSKEFNFVLFQDVTIEPVYKLEGDETTVKDLGATITFIENSRNQYNGGHYGSGEGSGDMPATRRTAGDRVYSDFLLSFSDSMELVNGKALKYGTAGEVFAGLIIETVDDIQKVDGQYVTKSDADYKEMYGATLTQISSKLSGYAADGETYITVNRENELKTFINAHREDSTVLSQGNFMISEFDATKLDNKNRLQYYYSLPNRKHQTLEDSLPRRYKVYRAYSYLRSADGSKIEISQVPVYFTIYDIGSIQNFAEAEAGGGYKS